MDRIRLLFETSLLQINSEIFDHEAKKLIRLSADESARYSCYVWII